MIPLACAFAYSMGVISAVGCGVTLFWLYDLEIIRRRLNYE
jgi:hypothetical protein